MTTDKAGLPNSALLGLINEYDGSTSATDFANSILEVKKLAGWTEEQTLRIIKLRLQGSALDYVIHDPKAKATETAEDLLALLQIQFTRSNVPELALQELTTSIEQQAHETIRGYAQRVRMLINKAAANDAERENYSKAAKYFFIKGLHPAIRRQVFSANPDTLDSAINIAAREMQTYQALTPHAIADHAEFTIPEHIGATRLGQQGSDIPPDSEILTILRELRSEIENMKLANRRGHSPSGGTAVRNMQPRRFCVLCHSPRHIATQCHTFQRSPRN